MIPFPLTLSLVPIFIGCALLLLTRKSTYQRLHEHAWRTNPIYRWPFPKSEQKQLRFVDFNRLFLRGVGYAALSVGALFFCGYLVTVADPFRGDRFDAQAWAEAGSCRGLSDWECVEKESTCPRGSMVRDLTNNHLLPQTTRREEVIELLGRSTYNVQINGLECPAYSLGMCSGIRIDYDSLYVCFNKDGTVASAGHVQH